ncbi:hypothetical protein Zmor_015576 [Zophobas morio]|uniref:Uncharacterized protein n=1 Tax=Zophobas morio TaxID=2755281 RepID=A0AA38IED9_9CUCU|nr:hypothetical protein Zmor_015576 [Zophobas morio]
MVGKKLELVLQKTEAIILCGPRKTDSICFNIEDILVKLAKNLKYFGVIIDANRSFEPRVEEQERLCYMGLPMLLCYMYLLCGSMLRKYRDKLLNEQRKSLLKMTAAYRTTSTAAIQVMASEPSLDLLVQERYSLFQRSKEQMVTHTVRQQEKRCVIKK